MFISGGLGDFYLFQEHFDPTQNSPCVDAGEQYILSDLEQAPPDGYNLDPDITTSIQNRFDDGFGDMGYHYPLYTGPAIFYDLTVSVTGDGYVRYHDANGVMIEVTESTSPARSTYLPATQVRLEAYAGDNHWGYWSGTDDDASWNTWNVVTMYGDRHV
ncbi:MAG: hypothetical protein ACYSU6_02910, partial [Planctomycetota bacterium]